MVIRHMNKMRYLALPIKQNFKDSSTMYLLISPKNLTQCKVVVTVVVKHMAMAEADEVNPNQEIEMVTVSIVADSISLSNIQHWGRNVSNATS